MKIGFIVESTLQGPEHQAVRSLMQCFCPRDQFIVLPQGNKGLLLKNAASDATRLFDQGCDRVFIMWDWHPAEVAWRQQARTKRYRDGDCVIDSVSIWKSLKATQHGSVCRENIVLLCIPQELEAWCLADEAALRSVLEDKVRGGVRVRTRRTRRPESEPYPEDVLDALFRSHNVEFQKFTDTPAIFRAASTTRFTRLGCCPSFVRLIEQLANKSFEEAVTAPPAAQRRRRH